jgi:hypothetical protein
MKEPSTPQLLGWNSRATAPTAYEHSAEWLAAFEAPSLRDTMNDVVAHFREVSNLYRRVAGQRWRRRHRRDRCAWRYFAGTRWCCTSRA